jgi:hypothetical protein
LTPCSKQEVVQREPFCLDTLKPTYYILKFAGFSLGFKQSYFIIVQMKKRNKNSHPFLGRIHSKESKLKMSFSSSLFSPVKLLDLEIGKEKLFNSSVQAASFLSISE